MIPMKNKKSSSTLRPTDNNGKVIICLPDTGESIDQKTPPLGTLSVAGYLESNNIPILHIDAVLHENCEQIIIDQISDGAICLALGFGTGPAISQAIRISEMVKDKFPNFPIIWGGWHPSLLPQQTLQHSSVDIIITGQGEITLYETVECLRNSDDLKKVFGIGYKIGENVIMTPPRPLVNLDEFPPMAYHLIDFKDYPGPPNRRSTPSDRFSNFRSSQGCPWRCAYCADPQVFNRRWMTLSIQNTVDELENLVNSYGITYVDFVDDTFIVNINRTKEFSKELIKRNLPLKWSGNVRTGRIAKLDDSDLDLMKKSGCDLIHPGVEASSQEMLDYIQKDEKHENTMIAAEKLKKAGITGLYAFMVSFPDEPDDFIDAQFEMIRNMKKLDPNVITPVNFYVPYPGNSLYERSKEKGFIPPANLEEWADFGTRIGTAVPWITQAYREKVMMLDKYLLPAAYPSRHLKWRMENTWWLGQLYKILSLIANFRVEKKWYKWSLDWKLIYSYWKFWEKWNRRIRLPNIFFR